MVPWIYELLLHAQADLLLGCVYLFILFSISDKVIAMISGKVTVMVNGIEWSIIHQVISWIFHDLIFV